jgi:hypothetical protein
MLKTFGIDEPMDVDTENPEQDENRSPLVERWRFDLDDSPTEGDDSEEHP